MKGYLVLLLAIFLCLAGDYAFSQTTADPAVAPLIETAATHPVETIKAAEALEPPGWLVDIVTFAQSIPYVGPAVVWVLKWAGFIAAVMTALALFLQALAAAMISAFSIAGLQEKADKVKAFFEKILPWVKYLSMLNAKKKQ